jgi:hypothetical protein
MPARWKAAEAHVALSDLPAAAAIGVLMLTVVLGGAALWLFERARLLLPSAAARRGSAVVRGAPPSATREGE